ncbi:MAG: VTT domain-containing protein [Dehalococcoidales bacterium]|nr:VTT domain-containing protein [Dehalococcoidales bacterium]
MNQEVKQRQFKMEIYLGALAIVATITLCAAALIYKDDLMSMAYMAGYSLLGLFIISFIAAGPLSATAIPVPYWLLVLTLPSVLAPQWGILAPVAVAITSALGDTLGDVPTFMIGYGGRAVSQRLMSKFNNYFSNGAMEWVRKHGSWASFTISVLFNPLHLPMTITLGTLRFSPIKFFIFDFLGALIKCLFLAFCGYYGLTSLVRFWERNVQYTIGHFALFIVAGVCVVIVSWQLVVWVGEIWDKNNKYEAAKASALRSGKPLLVAGGPWGAKPIRHWLNMPAHGNGDVCLDVNTSAIFGCPSGVLADVTQIPFSDKMFGAAFASHLLEHLPSTEAAKKALAELNRVADVVYIAYPSRQSIVGWLIADHHLHIWQKGNITYLKQRGRSVETCCHS